MNIKINYKTLIIDLELSELNVLVKNFKISLRNTLLNYKIETFDELNSKNLENLSNLTSKIVNDSTITSFSFNLSNSFDLTNELNDLLDDKYTLELYTTNPNNKKFKDNDVIRFEKNKQLKFIVSRNLIINSIKKTKEKHIPENLIMEITGAKEILKVDSKKSDISFMEFINRGSDDFFVQAIFSLHNRHEPNLMIGRNIQDRIFNRILNMRMSQRQQNIIPPINHEILNQLVEMGFDRSSSRRALRQSDNNLNLAIEYLANDIDVEYSSINSQSVASISNISNSQEED